ncbi:MAG: nuclear transport factor 2 family protein [Desulfobacterales bacterium]|jgi:hypothetical protein
MVKEITSLLLLLCLLMINVGCTSSVKEYEPISPDEEAVAAVVQEAQETWNNGNIKGWMALWHEDAKIMYGRERSIATKAEYEKIISERMAAHPTYKFSKPKITLSGDEATVKTSMMMRGRSSFITFNLIKQGSQWLLLSWKY